MKTKEMFSFLPLTSNSVTIALRFLLGSHISNHIIKDDMIADILLLNHIIKDYFAWVLLFNIFIDIMHITLAFNKRL